MSGPCYSNTEYSEGFCNGYLLLKAKRLDGINTGSGVMVYMFMEISGVTAIKNMDEEITTNTANPMAVALADSTYTHATTLFPDGDLKKYRRRYCCRLFFHDVEPTKSNVAALNRFFAFKDPITDDVFNIYLMKTSLVSKVNGLMPKTCTLDVVKYIADEMKEIICNAGLIYDRSENRPRPGIAADCGCNENEIEEEEE